jgi:hypothetical protein
VVTLHEAAVLERSVSVQWTIEFGGAPQDVTVITVGMASREAFMEKIDDVTSDRRWQAGMALLLDRSRLDTTPLSGRDVETVGDHLHRLGGRLGDAKVAIVAPDAYTAGVSVVMARYAAPAPFVALTFRSRDEATAWLREERRC